MPELPEYEGVGERLSSVCVCAWAAVEDHHKTSGQIELCSFSFSFFYISKLYNSEYYSNKLFLNAPPKSASSGLLTCLT